MRLSLLVPAAFLAGDALCAWMLKSAPAAVAVDRAQPLVVATYWQQFGARIWLAFAIAIAFASIGYIGALNAAQLWKSASHRYLAVTVALSALACAAALAFPVVFSSDVYAYAGYGDMALHGISPFAHARITLRDPLLDAMLWQWGNPPPLCVYGPAFVALARVIVWALLPFGAAAPLWGFRIVACIALIACAPLAYAAFAQFPKSTRLAAAAGIALNPVAIWSAAEGHNDTLALAIVLGGFALAARSRVFWGAFIVACSALVKAPGAVAAAVLAIASWPAKRRFTRAVAGAAAGIAVVAAFAVPLEYGARTQLAPAGRYFPQFSLQYVSIALAAIAVAALVAAACALPVKIPYLALAAWIAVPNPYPWYAVWLLPLAFLAWRSAPARALVAASLLIAVRYYAEVTTYAARPLSLAIIAVAFGLPLLILIADMAILRRDRREIRTPVPDFATPRSP